MKHWRIELAGLAIGALLCAVLPGVALALHDGGRDCYSCHSFSAGASQIQPGTASISYAAMSEFRNNGWVPGMRIGCTFCHRSVNATATMPDVLSSFAGATPNLASRHPVSRNYVTGTFDNTAYLSTDNTSFAQHLDCKDCHDTALVGYPDHNANWLANVGSGGAIKNNNPYGLRNVVALKAYDNLCRDCHGTGKTTFPSGKAIGKSIALVTHDNAVDNTVNAIKDLDNTHLRTQDTTVAGRQCTVCHDAHESQNLHLFSDGHESSETPIDDRADCTTVCHYRGDAVGNYDTHGHGKPQAFDNVVLARDCDYCHDVNQPHRPADTNYFVKYRFEPYDLSWNLPSVFGKPSRGICGNCHGTKMPHKISSPLNGSLNVGCIDCHDQHAKASDNNVMMIRNTNRVRGSLIGISGIGAVPGSESVLFQRSEKYPTGSIYHYWTNVPYAVSGDSANAGFCDQRACHGNRPFYPLTGFVNSTAHSGDVQIVNTDCESCHSHGDTGGSFRASSVCTSCHGQPPPPQDSSTGEIYIYNEFLSPHRVHGGKNTAMGYYPYDCRTCHVNYANAATHDTDGTLGYKTFQSVTFNDNVKMGAAAYDNVNLRCLNIYCHSDGRGGPPNIIPQWFNPAAPSTRQTLDCSGCHNPISSSGAHSLHLALNFTCSSCHYSTVSDNNSQLNPTSGMDYHVNKTIDVAIKPLFANDSNPAGHFDNATKVCSNITCHGLPVPWPATVLTCDSCHSYTSFAVPVTSNVYDYIYSPPTGTMSKVALGNFRTRGHGDNNGLAWDGSKVPNLICAGCHDINISHDNVLNPFRFKLLVNGRTVAPDNVNTLCTACHTNYLTRCSEHSRAVTGGGQFNWTHTQKCVDCHDVHGQLNLYMIFDNLAWRTDNTAWRNSDAYGFPLFPDSRVTVIFTDNNNGAGFASTDNGAPFNGICEACHVRTRQFANGTGSGTSGTNGHPSRGCLECHPHRTGFAGFGGSNVEQFFDNGIRAASASNYNDRSGHPLVESTTTLTYPSPEKDCLSCHGVGPLPSAWKSNECLKCHFEFRNGTAIYHPNGQFEWATPAAPGTQFGAAGPASDAFCLLCHSGGTPPTLGAISPTNVIQSGETWTGPVSSGHGSTSRLSGDNTVGPPSYSCRACHYSSVPNMSPALRDNNAPTFHASLNRKMVGNENAAIHEYPHPLDTDTRYDLPSERSARMDSFCAAKCHGNLANADSKDNFVVKHTWDDFLGQTQSGFQTHPSDMVAVPSAKFRAPDNLPLSDYIAGTLPGTGYEVCITCHNPHGGGVLRNSSGSSITGGGKQMLRRSFSDNASTICKECHL